MALSRVTLCGATMLVVLGHSAAVFAADCFVDSQNGDDTKDGSSEANAVKTQAKIPKACTVVRYKRGSLFNEKVAIGGSAKTYTNYGSTSDPLPKFVMPGTKNTGAVVSSNQGGVTIDGLSLANSHGDGSSASFSTGVCVMLGGNSVFQNNEITSCDIGVMLMGTGSKFLHNYVHDLNTMIVDASIDSGVNINSVGGAEGIFINGSNNEVAYNQFINCTTTAAWTGGSCDGGATEVAVGNNGTVSGLKIHHNFAYNTCGFFEASSGTAGGTFADSDFYDNVVVDSGWMFLLQINNTKFSNIRWQNNTIVYHKSSGTSYAPTPSMIYNGTGTTGGAATGTVEPNTIFFNNNLVIYAGFSSPGSLDKNISQANNLITTATAGLVKNVGASAVTPAPEDFDLVEASPAIDKGMAIASINVDFLNRAVPSGAAPDIGAFEYGATPSTEGGSVGFGGASATGGAANPATGGTGIATVGKGGTTATGGKANTSSSVALGGQPSTTTTSPQNGGQTSATSEGSQNGGQTSATSEGSQNGGQNSLGFDPSKGGTNDPTTESTDPGNPPAQGGATQTQGSSTKPAETTGKAEYGTQSDGCGCKISERSRSPIGLGLLGLLLVALRGRLARRRRGSIA